MEHNKSRTCLRTLEFIEVTTRIWGVLTMIVMWGVGADLTIHKHGLGAYTLFIAVILTIFETSFAINIYLDFIIKDEKNICFQCWQLIQEMDIWKKTALYLFLSIFCFIKPHEMWLAAIGGCMLLVLALLYLVFSYKTYLAEQETLMFDKECSYDRFEDLQDEIDDRLPEPNCGNVADQDTILRV
ncbi:transmembrane protein 72 [Parasteatoda tepidariorum]|uniref:transmembrane protein 72 n=1 Tax=Parasteatoda tepidariorum TaxID=114398 RepID=UPI00077FB553|nr:transmembrane protein 72 [Parasteatoda tepidariorum]